MLRTLKISVGHDGPPAAACDYSYYYVHVTINGKHLGAGRVPSDHPCGLTEEDKSFAASRAFTEVAKSVGVLPGHIIEVVESPGIKAPPGSKDSLIIAIPPGRYKVLSIDRFDQGRTKFFTSDWRKKSSAYLWRLDS